MNIFSIQKWALLRTVLAGVLLAVVAGCSSTNLGDIDESEDPRENMASPSVLADDEGNSPLTLKTGKDKEAEKSVVASASATDEPTTDEPTRITDEQTEFEQFKKWDHLRTNDPDSPEYQEFLEWQKYQKFKAGQ